VKKEENLKSEERDLDVKVELQRGHYHPEQKMEKEQE
jgi:hypothetical protein